MQAGPELSGGLGRPDSLSERTVDIGEKHIETEFEFTHQFKHIESVMDIELEFSRWRFNEMEMNKAVMSVIVPHITHS